MKMFITLLLFSLGSTVQAQSSRLYAFSQRVSGGANVGEATMDGNTTVQKKTKEGIRQLIYLSLPAGVGEVAVTELWIKGKEYTYTVNEVKGPIMDETGIRMPSQQKKQLVPVGGRIFQVLPGKEKDPNAKTSPGKMARDNEVFLCYSMGNKKDKLAVKQFEVLQDLLME
jgi:hypothetical protein